MLCRGDSQSILVAPDSSKRHRVVFRNPIWSRQGEKIPDEEKKGSPWGKFLDSGYRKNEVKRQVRKGFKSCWGGSGRKRERGKHGTVIEL